jgi:hypothetical protein
MQAAVLVFWRQIKKENNNVFIFLQNKNQLL